MNKQEQLQRSKPAVADRKVSKYNSQTRTMVSKAESEAQEERG